MAAPGEDSYVGCSLKGLHTKNPSMKTPQGVFLCGSSYGFHIKKPYMVAPRVGLYVEPVGGPPPLTWGLHIKVLHVGLSLGEPHKESVHKDCI